MNIVRNLLGGVCAVALSATALQASALTVYQLNATEVGAFGSGSYGSVSLTQSGADVLVSVNLRSDLNFVDTGAHSIFTFNLTGPSTTADIVNISFANGLGDLFAVAGPANNSPFGGFAYGIRCNAVQGNPCVNGASGGGYVDPLSFLVKNATEAEFAVLSSGGTNAYFAADAYLANSVNTGVVGATLSPIPEPETYALMLAGLGVMGFVARRRRPSA